MLKTIRSVLSTAIYSGLVALVVACSPGEFKQENVIGDDNSPKLGDVLENGSEMGPDSDEEGQLLYNGEACNVVDLDPSPNSLEELVFICDSPVSRIGFFDKETGTATFEDDYWGNLSLPDNLKDSKPLFLEYFALGGKYQVIWQGQGGETTLTYLPYNKNNGVADGKYKHSFNWFQDNHIFMLAENKTEEDGALLGYFFPNLGQSLEFADCAWELAGRKPVVGMETNEGELAVVSNYDSTGVLDFFDFSYSGSPVNFGLPFSEEYQSSLNKTGELSLEEKVKAVKETQLSSEGLLPLATASGILFIDVNAREVKQRIDVEGVADLYLQQDLLYVSSNGKEGSKVSVFDLSGTLLEEKTVPGKVGAIVVDEQERIYIVVDDSKILKTNL